MPNMLTSSITDDLLALAEVHGNRTHHGHRLPATGFEVQEAHQDLSTSNIKIKGCFL